MPILVVFAIILVASLLHPAMPLLQALLIWALMIAGYHAIAFLKKK